MINSISFTGKPRKPQIIDEYRITLTGRILKYPPNMEPPKAPPGWLESINKKLESINEKSRSIKRKSKK